MEVGIVDSINSLYGLRVQLNGEGKALYDNPEKISPRKLSFFERVSRLNKNLRKEMDVFEPLKEYPQENLEKFVKSIDSDFIELNYNLAWAPTSKKEIGYLIEYANEDKKFDESLLFRIKGEDFQTLHSLFPFEYDCTYEFAHRSSSQINDLPYSIEGGSIEKVVEELGVNYGEMEVSKTQRIEIFHEAIGHKIPRTLDLDILKIKGGSGPAGDLFEKTLGNHKDVLEVMDEFGTAFVDKNIDQYVGFCLLGFQTYSPERNLP